MFVAPPALKNVLPVEDSLRKCAHLVVSAQISLQVKHLTQVCQGEKQSQHLSTTSPLWLWRRLRLVVHFRYTFLSFLCCGISCFKNDFITMSKRTCFIFQPIFPHLFQYIGWPEGTETDIVASSDSFSHLIYRVFPWYILTFFCYCTAGLQVKLWSILIVT